MKNKILPTCLQGNYGESLEEFSNMLYGIGEAFWFGLLSFLELIGEK